MESGHLRQQQEELHTELPYHSSLQQKKQNEEEEEKEEKQQHRQQQEEVNLQKEKHVRVSPVEEEEEEEEGEEKEQKTRIEGNSTLKESNLQKEKETRLTTGGEEDEKQQHKACLDQSSTQIEVQAEDSSQHLQSQKGRRHLAGSGDSTEEPEALSPRGIATTTTNADLLPSPNGNGSISSFPCSQVEGVLQSCLTTAESRATKLLQQAMDTVQSQVLCALHQAANDIIEHLGKDAAHRVAVAERKAAVLEQELSSIKQQALSMLLRLKADTDAQVLEAEKKYLVERRRAQDAEAKLVTAQDTSKRLKLELRKKGDILEKMQKLVQPVNEDYLHKSSRLSEATDHRGSGNRSKGNDLHMKSPDNRMLFNMENASLLACNGIPQQEVQCSALQPNTAAGQAADNDLEKRGSRSTTSEEDPLEVQWRTSSSARTLQDSHYTPGPHKRDIGPEETHEEEILLLRNGGDINTDHGGPVEESCQMMLLVSNLERDDRLLVDQRHDAQLLPKTERLEENAVPILSDGQISLDDKDIGTVKAPNASIKGFYVRRRARENGKCLEKEGKGLAMGKPSLSSMQDFDLKIGSGETSSGQVESKVKADMLERDLQRCSEDGIDVTGLRCFSGHLTQGREPLALKPGKNGKGELLEKEACGNAHGKDSELATSTSKDQGLVTAAEFARPDYEVATSLAELAVIGREAGSQQGEVSPSTARKEEIFIKPGRTGLRMKRKGASFKKKVCSGLEGKAAKKPRLDKGDTGLPESHTGRVLRRTRAVKSTTSKDDLTVESSRDSRRLMQGARQLLCLAEKKWR